MATTKQTQAAKRNVKKAQKAAAEKRTIAHMPKKTASPKTRAELYEMARRRDLPGRSKMGRDELASKLGVK
jgi:hypothetical protein